MPESCSIDKFALMSRVAELLGARSSSAANAVENLDFQIGTELLRGQAPSFMQPKVTARRLSPTTHAHSGR